MMNAFVFSGGANLGSIQAGMAQALLEAGIRPDILVGTSIGAANAAVLAGDPTPEGGARLVEMWSKAKGKHIFPIRPTKLVRQLLGKGAMFSPGPFARFVEAGLSFTAIENALVPLRIVATRFDDGAEHVFEAGPVMDAVLASTALPLIYPAHDVAGTLYLDGGLSNNVPLQPALAAGADTIYVLSVGFPCPPPEIKRSARSILMHSLGILLSQRIRADEGHLPVHYPGVRIVQVPPVCTQADLRDLSRSAVLAAQARRQTTRFLLGDECPACEHRTPRIPA